MVTDFFMKIEGIEGASTDQNHSGWIDVMDFSHGSIQESALSKAQDTSGKGQFTPFSFTHLVDKATPKLQNYCMSGKKINKIEFQVCRSVAGSQVAVYEVTMENVKIAKAEVQTYQGADSSDSTYQSVEVVDLNVGKMTWKVTPIKSDNTKDGVVEAAFDQTTNS